MLIISCDANPFYPVSSHGDISYYGYCMLLVLYVCNSPQESVSILYLYTISHTFDSKPQGLGRQTGSEGLIPVSTDLRSVLLESPPPNPPALYITKKDL